MPLRLFCFLLIALLNATGFADTDQPGSALAKAERLSSLTGSGAVPFHLKLLVSEPANPKSKYTATIEEYWKSRDNWVRTVDSPQFHQRVIVDGKSRKDESDGDYYPLWLRDFVAASIDPLEDSAFWQQVSAKIVLSSPVKGSPSKSCARAQFKVGTPTVNYDAFAVICFNQDGTLSSILRLNYGMDFSDIRPFGKKQIAFRYVDDIEPGTELVGQVQILERLDESQPISGPQNGGLPNTDPVQFVTVNQETFEKLLEEPLKLTWPPVNSGNITGKLSMYVAADRNGQIRGAYPLNSDNAGLQDSARDQLLKVRLKPAAVGGSKVQIETALAFEFSSHLADTPMTQDSGTRSNSDDAQRKPLSISAGVAAGMLERPYAPVYPQDLKQKRLGGTVVLNAIIDTNGRIASLSPVSSPNSELTEAATNAVRRWLYRPYLLNGKPTAIQTEIKVTFQVP